MQKLFPKNSTLTIIALVLAILIVILTALNFISFRVLQSSILGPQSGVYDFESRNDIGQIILLVHTEVANVNPGDKFAFPLRVAPQLGSKLYGIAAKVRFEETLIPDHYTSNVLTDQGSVLKEQEEHILATMTPRSDETVLLAINGTANGPGTVIIDAEFSLDFKTIPIHMEIHVNTESADEVQPPANESGAPVAITNPPIVTQINTKVVLDGSKSTGEDLQYAWIGPDEQRANAIFGSNAKKEVTFANPGTYRYILVVKNDIGTAESSQIVSVNRGENSPPVIQTRAPEVIHTGESVMIEVQATHPAGIEKYEWSGPNITVDQAHPSRATYSRASTGTDTLTVTARDKTGGIASRQIVIEARNFGNCWFVDINDDKKCDIYDLSWWLEAYDNDNR
jgi:hypothetical protein